MSTVTAAPRHRPTDDRHAAGVPASLRLAAAVRAMATAARRLGLVMPGFRSPPRVLDAQRTIRRHRSGGATVAVRLSGRPWAAVLADLVEGVVVANGLGGAAADTARAALWAAVAPTDDAGGLAA